MFAFIDSLYYGTPFIIRIAMIIFWGWMLVDAIMRQEWIWVVLIVIFPLSPLFYFIFVYLPNRRMGGGGGGGFHFEIPGTADRRRIEELKGQIHHLDKAHHHMELGDIYLRQGKTAEAEKCYQSAFERDAEDADIRARLGAINRKKNPREARKFLEAVCAENPDHDYGNTQMALAETLTELGDTEAAKSTWLKVLERHSYSRARVQLAELFTRENESDKAIGLLKEVIEDHKHTPKFARNKESEWISRAKKLLNQVKV